ncbi:MAG: hypothetical protein IH926_06105, partial [Proteobacteria bacterium]|nr:hypothetical protein [Pseudomonadota bacterium]
MASELQGGKGTHKLTNPEALVDALRALGIAAKLGPIRSEDHIVRGPERERLRDERRNWDQERQAQSAELRRQQDMLELHAENLEGRRERLDRLRAELEETHNSTLEMRIAVEEA